MDYNCIICEKKLNPKTMKCIGMCQETGEWTLNEEKATQGYFDIGAGC